MQLSGVDFGHDFRIFFKSLKILISWINFINLIINGEDFDHDFRIFFKKWKILISWNQLHKFDHQCSCLGWILATIFETFF